MFVVYNSPTRKFWVLCTLEVYMATESIILTKEGYKKLEEELEILVKEKRGEAAERVKQAREFGDLSENAEYDAAKEDQGRLEAKILEIEATLKYAKVIDDSELDLSVISVGCVVKMHDEPQPICNSDRRVAADRLA